MKCMLTDFVGQRRKLINKKTLVTTALAAIVFNCSATRLVENYDETQGGIFYQIQKDVTGKAPCISSEFEKEEFDALNSIILDAWDNRNNEKYNLGLVDVYTDEEIMSNVSLQNHLVLSRCAWLCFSGQTIMIDWTATNQAIDFCSKTFGFNASDELKDSVKQYLFDRRNYNAAFWIKNIKIYGETKDKRQCIQYLQERFNYTGYKVWQDIHEKRHSNNGIENKHIKDKANDKQLKAAYLKTVCQYLETEEDFENFKHVSNKCKLIVAALKRNPIPITNSSCYNRLTAIYENGMYHYSRIGIGVDRPEEYYYHYSVRIDKVGSLFPNIRTQCVYRDNDALIVDKKNCHKKTNKVSIVCCEKMYKVPYREYLKDIKTENFINIKYKSGIYLWYEAYESEKKRLNDYEARFFGKHGKYAAIDEDSSCENNEKLRDSINALRNAMAQFIIEIFFDDWEQLSDEQKNELSDLKDKKLIKDINVIFYLTDNDVDQFGNASVPYGATHISYRNCNVSAIKSLVFSKTVNFWYACFLEDFHSLSSMRFKNKNVAFEQNVLGAVDCKLLKEIIVDIKEEKDLEDFDLMLRYAELPEHVLVIPNLIK